jgi:hypothetical protein
MMLLHRPTLGSCVRTCASAAGLGGGANSSGIKSSGCAILPSAHMNPRFYTMSPAAVAVSSRQPFPGASIPPIGQLGGAAGLLATTCRWSSLSAAARSSKQQDAAAATSEHGSREEYAPRLFISSPACSYPVPHLTWLPLPFFETSVGSSVGTRS